MKKKNLIVLAATAVIATLTFFAINSRASSDVDRDAIVEYASSHFNDGKGLCAEFASDAINNGGVSCWSQSASVLRSQLLNSGLGEEYVLPLESDGSVRIGDYPGLVEEGDLVFYHCSGCNDGRPYIHVVVCANSSSDEMYLRAYSHNRANSGSSTYRYNTRCYACGSIVDTVSVYHFDTGHDPEGCIDSVSYDGKLHIYGWAFDRDTSEPIRCRATLGGPDGSGAYTVDIRADGYRDDVAAVYGIQELCGIAYECELPDYLTGTQDVYVYAMNDFGEGDNVLLGIEQIDIQHAVNLSVNEKNADITCGDTANIGFHFSGVGIHSVSYELSEKNIADFSIDSVDWSSCSGSGMLTPKTSGSTDLTIKLCDETGNILAQEAVSITVSGHEGCASMSESYIELKPGDSSDLTMYFEVQGARTIQPALDENIVNIKYGPCGTNSLPMTVTALNEGTTTISFSIIDMFGKELARTSFEVCVKSPASDEATRSEGPDADEYTPADPSTGDSMTEEPSAECPDTEYTAAENSEQVAPEDPTADAVVDAIPKSPAQDEMYEDPAFIQKCRKYYETLKRIYGKLHFREWYEKYIVSGVISKETIINYFKE